MTAHVSFKTQGGADLNVALRSDDAIYRRFGERIERLVLTSHELGLEEVAGVAVVLELALVQLHRQVWWWESRKEKCQVLFPYQAWSSCGGI